MNNRTPPSGSSSSSGRIASLHLHPVNPGAPLHDVEALDVVATKGIAGDNRYFAKLSRSTGEPNRRQVTLIEREQIAEHAVALGLGSIRPGAVRSNMETTGINLIAVIGKEIQIGDAILFLYAPRDPCARMDAICQGLRERMMDRRQGVLAEVRASGTIRVGDEVRVRA